LTPETEVPEKQTKRVSVVIISLNRVESLRRTLALLGEAHQVIVVDNGSRDGSAVAGDDFPGVRSMRLPKNFGSTKALNVGLRTADGEYVLFLHDDTLISGESVARLADFLEGHPEAYAVCPLLTDESGNTVPQVCPLPAPDAPDPPLQTIPEDSSDVMAAYCVSGAAIMYRASFLRSLRQIDERYGDYGSIIELCAQVRRAGRSIFILRGITAVHEGLKSPVPASMLESDRVTGTAVFLAKHHGFASSLLYRIKTALIALLTFKFSLLSGAIGGQKIDGTV
jgi:N-acetylglucosaminyl-diphospho-decaprenol L-rhamnosyltransferase